MESPSPITPLLPKPASPSFTLQGLGTWVTVRFQGRQDFPLSPQLRLFTLLASLVGAASPCQIWMCISRVLPTVPFTPQSPLHLGKQRPPLLPWGWGVRNSEARLQKTLARKSHRVIPGRGGGGGGTESLMHTRWRETVILITSCQLLRGWQALWPVVVGL